MSNETPAPSHYPRDPRLGCPECGSTVDGAVVFCRHCGEPLPDRSGFLAPAFILTPPEVIEDTIVFPQS